MGFDFKQLKQLRHIITIDPAWKEGQRDVLLAKISAQKGVRQLSVFDMMRGRIHVSLRPVTSFVFAIVVLFGGLIASVSASEDSLPGQFLYSVKLTSEKIQTSLVFNESKKSSLQLEHAQRRVQEIQQVLASSQTPDTKNLIKPLQEYQKTLVSLQATVDKLDSGQAVILAQEIRETAKNAKSTIAAVASRSAESEEEASQVVAQAQETSSQAELNAVVTIAKQTTDKEKAKETLEQYIQELDDATMPMVLNISQVGTTSTDTVTEQQEVETADEQLVVVESTSTQIGVATDEQPTTLDSVVAEAVDKTPGATYNDVILDQGTITLVKQLLAEGNVELAVGIIEKAIADNAKKEADNTAGDAVGVVTETEITIPIQESAVEEEGRVQEESAVVEEEEGRVQEESAVVEEEEGRVQENGEVQESGVGG